MGLPPTSASPRFAIARGTHRFRGARSRPTARRSSCLKLLRERIGLAIPEVGHTRTGLNGGGNASREVRTPAPHAGTRTAESDDAGTLFDHRAAGSTSTGNTPTSSRTIIRLPRRRTLPRVEIKSFAVERRAGRPGQGGPRGQAVGRLRGDARAARAGDLATRRRPLSHDVVLVCPENFATGPPPHSSRRKQRNRAAAQTCTGSPGRQDPRRAAGRAVLRISPTTPTSWPPDRRTAHKAVRRDRTRYNPDCIGSERLAFFCANESPAPRRRRPPAATTRRRRGRLDGDSAGAGGHGSPGARNGGDRGLLRLGHPPAHRVAARGQVSVRSGSGGREPNVHSVLPAEGAKRSDGNDAMSILLALARGLRPSVRAGTRADPVRHTHVADTPLVW